jgi:hypothetical protein
MMLLSLILCLLPGPDASPNLRIQADSDVARIEVIASLPKELTAKLAGDKLTQEQGEAWLRLRLVNGETRKEGPSIFGKYELREGKLLFKPRHALAHGQLYRARLELGKDKALTAEYRVPPRPPAPPAVVEKIYPSSDVLPANHLRFYIYFSRPMRGGKDLFKHLHILDDKGKEVRDPWLIEELWDETENCLILYIHPGRIKWGLALRELLGPVLHAGREYTLVVDADMLDADERKLGKAYTRKFRTTAEDRQQLFLSEWKARAPAAGTKQPLVVEFGKVIDRGSLLRRLTVVDGKGNDVSGKIEIGKAERSWSFHPSQAWQAAEYRVKVSGNLEDSAGNTPLRPFDLDLKGPAPKAQPLTIPFRPGAETSGAVQRKDAK